MLNLQDITNEWTLFLDRDGVINIEKKNGYVCSHAEFTFYPNTLAALANLRKYFGKILIATNQRVVGKKIITEDTLQDIHARMITQISNTGGRIDAIYYATACEDDNFYRKPQIGMALKAQEEYPEIQPSKSIMIGNSMSDMEFGKNAGMHTVFVRTTNKTITEPNAYIDLVFDDLHHFAQSLLSTNINSRL